MKRTPWIYLVIAFCLVIAVYALQGSIRQAWGARGRLFLPPATRFNADALASTKVVGEQNSPVEGGAATSQHFVLVSSPVGVTSNVDPFADTGLLPVEANLDVPFTSQAPTGDWSFPYQEACEEASAIMVDAYYRGISGTIPSDQAKLAIDALVGYEQTLLGEYKDTNALDTATFVKGYFGYSDVIISPLVDMGQIKRAIANGFPVILPADGKLLPNQNFRNGGPTYHMLVVKGYTKDRFITNDPGTRNGADFTYSSSALLAAAHDWNGGDVIHGTPVMMVIIPKTH